MEIVLKGIAASPGIAIGAALTFGVQSLDIPKYEVDDPAPELERWSKAVESVRAELERLRDEVARDLGPQEAEIFKAQLMMLDDVTLREELEGRLREERYNVEYLLDDLLANYSAMMASVEEPRFRERAQDVVDVGRRILGKLLNAELESLEKLDAPSIVVAHDISPADTAKVDIENVLGIATDLGGPTSHTAILARAFELPAVVGLQYLAQHATRGDVMVVDGARGQVILRPSEDTLQRFREEKQQLESRRSALLLAEKQGPSTTLDGFELPVLANIELPVEVSQSLRAHAQGIGLYRTEYFFLNRTSLPSEEEQYQAYREVAEAINPLPVILRTVDLGGDKFAAHLRQVEEINPQLGWRAIRFCLERPDIFKAQLRAILRASVAGNMQVMFPLISGLNELLEVKEVFREVCDDFERRGQPFDKDMKVGIMVEVPSAVMVAEELARECDFFSIGTNDLIQYSLAVDRVNEKIAHMYEPAHPAVLRMIRMTVQAARSAKIPVSLCGEMAGDPQYTELLAGLGLNSLSMSSVLIPMVRAQVSTMRMSEARRFAKKVLALSSVDEIKNTLRERYDTHRGADRLLAQAAHESGE